VCVPEGGLVEAETWWR